MELKEKLTTSFVTFKDDVHVASDIDNIRTKALENFKELGFPTKKLEAWKYTSLKSILKKDYTIFPKQVAITLEDINQYFIHDIDTHKVVFVNGEYDSSLSQISDDTIEISLMSSALTRPKYHTIIEKYFNNIAKQDNLTSLNTAFASEGIYIHVPKNVAVQKPVQILYFTTDSKNAVMTQPRNLIIAEQNAHIQIIERHQSLTSNDVLTNAVTEVFAAKDATIDIYKIQNDYENASLVDNSYIEQKSNSIVSVHTFSFGGNITRNNLNFYQKGQHIDSILKGITISEAKQHIDHHTLVHHIEPNCESHQDYKGIYAGRSTAVFNGKVIVEKEAQKTNAYQQNNNILISDKATINAKPQLEIFADDVKCSHGCTIGQLDENALFYMQQRGIPKKEAKALLMYAFANTVLESVKIPEVKTRINKLIANKLGVNIGLDL